MKIFVCAPLRSKTRLGEQSNLIRTLEFCRAVSDDGHIPISSAVMFSQFLDDTIPEERRKGIDAGIEMLKLCDELWVFSQNATPGMAKEIHAASLLGIPVVYKV